jgi:putative thioredoxin
VNSDENMELSQQFGIRSIPDVRAFRDGKLVDGFMGALPESQVRAFIDRVVPSPAEAERLRAAELRAGHDLAGAVAALRSSVDLDPTHHLARVDLAEALVHAGQHKEAATHLDTVPEDPDWDRRVATLRQAIAYASAGGNEKELAARVESNPADFEARLDLAGVLAARKSWRGAMDQLLEIIRRDKNWRDGEARRQMIAILNLAEDEPEVVSEYRRKLGAALN